MSDESRNKGDRRHPSLGEIAIVVSLLMQLMVVVWGAAVLKTSVDGLTLLFAELKLDVKSVQADLTQLKIDVKVANAKSIKGN